MRLEELNALDADAAARELLRCCGSPRWAEQMADLRPFAGAEALAAAADRVFVSLDRAAWLEAFAAHPQIGAGGAGASPRSAKASAERGVAADWSEQEQARVADAAGATLLRLAGANRDYEARFGYIFIVCATGKSAAEMLDVLECRMGNDPDTEIRIAANEQRKITRLRLMKLVEGKQDISMITTHVLDIARGEPAEGVTVILELRQASEWTPIGRGTTDGKGRVTTLTDGPLAPGTYRLTFDIGTYHRELGLAVSFFPEVKITFNVRDPDEHFHLPLLLSPFGYTTYRGT